MQKLAMIYEGKAKKVYRTDNPDYYWVEYKDDATAFNGQKKGTIDNKGVVNNKVSAVFFQLLEKEGIPTHFVELVSDREMIVKALQIIKVEVVVRNIVAGSLAKRIGLPEGTLLPRTVLEYYYKDDALGDPLINASHIAALELATPEQMAYIKETALRVNEIMRQYLAPVNIDLIDYKLEFGLHKGQVLLGDEISPDTCRFWDKTTGEKLDKDRFRRDLGNVAGAYREVLRRLTGE
ncbi:phosphoribosylaminoimidazolesuccinocarboxamide synthase [Desulforamulus hydrothermalis]|uniref:Phosphoribosylaminoimidazole-succinocarboxamide synthase n=1 Tax=Desulforamulus hydrothermalis Lam5 = DSM 18033 TaxID=1121428 RepID=K8E0R7_9FIRM|nr:phosphoribosylaminoimidazolesuccinocarboxamide synthase [Desulforamulus hydrothermalis]CCO09224.1 Phosphoribosylaminoimidazole-succinocarboxamide synthase [Desulforamulus hydrothermalis Lam5 = DSM 18033]SHH06158.1 phosphoribosylaminoimidazole-succinocarboxamide synthase [Desulforamulus hydrothermalis Lam5 = DSM 18033]